MTAARKVWTAEDVRAQGVRMDGVVACAVVLGVGRTVAYRLLKSGDVPFRVLRAGGGRYVVPTADVLRVLGLDDDQHQHSPADLVSDDPPVTPRQGAAAPVMHTRERARR